MQQETLSLAKGPGKLHILKRKLWKAMTVYVLKEIETHMITERIVAVTTVKIGSSILLEINHHRYNLFKPNIQNKNP